MIWSRRKLFVMLTAIFMACMLVPANAFAAVIEQQQAASESAVPAEHRMPRAKRAHKNLPKSLEFQRQTGDIASGETFSIVSSSTFDGKLRIVHVSNGTSKIDRCIATQVGDTLQPTDCTIQQFAGTGAHTWTIEAVEGGFTIKSQTEGGSYLHIENGSVSAADGAQVLSIEKLTGAAPENTYAIGRNIGDATYYLTYTAGGWTSTTNPYGVYLYKKTEVEPSIVPNGNPTTGTTHNQPFDAGTGNSQYFRIPSLITLSDGTLLAAIDARWNTTVDAGGLDTLVSRSTDGGKTWTYSFANYFNDSTDAYNNRATAFIDPVMIQDKSGTIHLMVDVWPGGVALNSAANNHPVDSSGYAKIDGTCRLVLYASPNPDTQRAAGAEQGKGYTHYVGDFGEDGFAPVINVATGEAEHYVDHHYYLFDVNKEPEYCSQIGSSSYVQQNVFFYNADLHVVATSHLWKISSSDGGKTWSDPVLLNEYVRTGLDHNDSFYGVGPGRGLVSSTGRIILPCYTFIYGHGDGVSSVIYSDDGQRWHRSQPLSHQTSEATLVEAEGKIYLFARHGIYAVSTDNGATWQEEKQLASATLPLHTNCQIDAITYSQKIDGKTAILLSCPTGNGRANGAVFVGLVQDDGSINWKYRYEVTKGGAAYSYSCLTEKADGTIGLLYESSNGGATYVDLKIEDIAVGAEIGSYVVPPTFTWAPDHSSATATFKHSTGSESKTIEATITSERIDPTAISEGKITYTATVSFEGATYTDQQIVVLPATGESKDPNEPGGQSGESSGQTNGSGEQSGNTGSHSGTSQGTHAKLNGHSNSSSSKRRLVKQRIPQTGDVSQVSSLLPVAGFGLALLGSYLRRRSDKAIRY